MGQLEFEEFALFILKNRGAHCFNHHEHMVFKSWLARFEALFHRLPINEKQFIENFKDYTTIIEYFVISIAEDFLKFFIVDLLKR